jgi:hypothetical protein
MTEKTNVDGIDFVLLGRNGTQFNPSLESQKCLLNGRKSLQVLTKKIGAQGAVGCSGDSVHQAYQRLVRTA